MNIVSQLPSLRKGYSCYELVAGIYGQFPGGVLGSSTVAMCICNSTVDPLHSYTYMTADSFMRGLLSYCTRIVRVVECEGVGKTRRWS